MAEQKVTKDTIAVEDIDFGTGTKTRSINSAGLSKSVTKVNASHLPIVDSAEVFTAEDVEATLKELYDDIQTRTTNTEFDTLEDDLQQIFGQASTPAVADQDKPWFDTGSNQWKYWDGASWVPVNTPISGRYEETVVGGDWSGAGPYTITITHGLGEIDVLGWVQVDGVTAPTNLAFDRSTATTSECTFSNGAATAGRIIVMAGAQQSVVGSGAITTAKIADGAVTPVKLSGGVASPGNNKYYGQDPDGNDGFHNLPTTHDLVRKSTSFSIPANDTLGNKSYSNGGASGEITFTLPDAAEDRKVTIVSEEAETILVAPASGDNFLVGENTFNTLIVATQGTVITLRAVDATTWVVDKTDLSTSGDTGLFLGGSDTSGTAHDDVEKITISTSANSTDVGNLSANKEDIGPSGAGNNITGDALITGADESGVSNKVEKVSTATPASGSNVGTLTESKDSVASAGNGIGDKMIAAGGQLSSAKSDVIERVTVSTGTDAANIGTLSLTKGNGSAASNAESDRMIIMGGEESSTLQDNIEAVNIATGTSASDIADMVSARDCSASASNGINDRIVTAGGRTTFGGSAVKDCDTKNISNDSDAVDFVGELRTARCKSSACSNGTTDRMVVGGGSTDSTDTNATDEMDFISITGFSNSQLYGDLTQSLNGACGVSNG